MLLTLVISRLIEYETLCISLEPGHPAGDIWRLQPDIADIADSAPCTHVAADIQLIGIGRDIGLNGHGAS